MLSFFLSISKGVFKTSIFFISSIKLLFWVYIIYFSIDFNLFSISSFKLLFLFFLLLLTISLSFCSSFPISYSTSSFLRWDSLKVLLSFGFSMSLTFPTSSFVSIMSFCLYLFCFKKNSFFLL